MNRSKCGQKNKTRYGGSPSFKLINFSTVVPAMMTQQGNSHINFRSLLLEGKYKIEFEAPQNVSLIFIIVILNNDFINYISIFISSKVKQSR